MVKNTVTLWSSELECDVVVQLSPKFMNWYDGNRRKYARRYPNEDEEHRLKLAYNDFMER